MIPQSYGGGGILCHVTQEFVKSACVLTIIALQVATYFLELQKGIFLSGPAFTLGGHLTFQILTLLRYVVDIGLNSPNPKFF